MPPGEPSTLTPARAEALEGVPCFAWDTEAPWQEHFGQLKAYVEEHGGLPKPGDEGLSAWVRGQLSAYAALKAGRHSKLTAERAVALEALPGWKAL